MAFATPQRQPHAQAGAPPAVDYGARGGASPVPPVASPRGPAGGSPEQLPVRRVLRGAFDAAQAVVFHPYFQQDAAAVQINNGPKGISPPAGSPGR